MAHRFTPPGRLCLHLIIFLLLLYCNTSAQIVIKEKMKINVFPPRSTSEATSGTVVWKFRYTYQACCLGGYGVMDLSGPCGSYHELATGSTGFNGEAVIELMPMIPGKYTVIVSNPDYGCPPPCLNIYKHLFWYINDEQLGVGSPNPQAGAHYDFYSLGTLDHFRVGTQCDTVFAGGTTQITVTGQDAAGNDLVPTENIAVPNIPINFSVTQGSGSFVDEFGNAISAQGISYADALAGKVYLKATVAAPPGATPTSARSSMTTQSVSSTQIDNITVTASSSYLSGSNCDVTMVTQGSKTVKIIHGDSYEACGSVPTINISPPPSLFSTIDNNDGCKEKDENGNLHRGATFVRSVTNANFPDVDLGVCYDGTKDCAKLFVKSVSGYYVSGVCLDNLTHFGPNGSGQTRLSGIGNVTTCEMAKDVMNDLNVYIIGFLERYSSTSSWARYYYDVSIRAHEESHWKSGEYEDELKSAIDIVSSKDDDCKPVASIKCGRAELEKQFDKTKYANKIKKALEREKESRHDEVEKLARIEELKALKAFRAQVEEKIKNCGG